MSTEIHLEHEDNVVICHDVGEILVDDVMCNDFLMCPYSGHVHLVAKSQEGQLVTLWDCDGHGHLYSPTTPVRVSRPAFCRNRVWPTSVQEHLSSPANPELAFDI